MLPNENPAFAALHRDQLRDQIDWMESAINGSDSSEVIVTREDLEGWILKMRGHIRAFDRYELCFKDEQDTKNRYEKKLTEIRLEQWKKDRTS